MSTDSNQPSNSSTSSPSQSPQPASSGAPTSNVTEMVQVMSRVDTSSPQAQLNSTSISDGNGGRITLDDHVTGLKGTK